MIDECLTGNTIQFCQEVTFQVGYFNLTPDFRIFGIKGLALTIPAFPKPALPLPPAFELINKLLEELRKLVTWSIVLAAVVSRILDIIASLRTHAGCWKLLTNLSIFLALGVVFCTLLYTQVNLTG